MRLPQGWARLDNEVPRSGGAGGGGRRLRVSAAGPPLHRRIPLRDVVFDDSIIKIGNCYSGPVLGIFLMRSSIDCKFKMEDSGGSCKVACRKFPQPSFMLRCPLV